MGGRRRVGDEAEQIEDAMLVAVVAKRTRATVSHTTRLLNVGGLSVCCALDEDHSPHAVASGG